MFFISKRAKYMYDPRLKYFKLSFRDIRKTARRRGVEREFVWLYVDGQLYSAQNVQDEKEIVGKDHYSLSMDAGVNLSRDYPRGFVTFNDDGTIEIQTYGKSFWEMPTKLQDKVETRFDIKPGQYSVGPVLELPPQFKSVIY